MANTPLKPEEIEAIKAKLDTWIGLQSQMVPWENSPSTHVEFQYLSPTGVLIFTIAIHRFRDAWRFASRTGLPKDVDQLRLMIDPQQGVDEQAMKAVCQD